MRVAVERTEHLKSPPAQIWPLVADTERVNRAVGLGAIAPEPNSDATAARYLVSTVSAGFPLEYEERPFEWVEGRWFSVRRVMRRGVLRSIDHGIRLRPAEDGGTVVTILVAARPKLDLLAPIVRVQSGAVIRRMLAQLRAADAELLEGRPGGHGMPAPVVHAAALERASAELRARLDREDQPIAAKLLALLRESPDVEVDRMRPFELARAWQAPQRRVLRAFLHGVVAGLVDLRWDLICPSCHTTSEHVDALDQLASEAQCHLCDISFGVELDSPAFDRRRPEQRQHRCRGRRSPGRPSGLGPGNPRDQPGTRTWPMRSPPRRYVDRGQRPTRWRTRSSGRRIRTTRQERCGA